MARQPINRQAQSQPRSNGTVPSGVATAPSGVATVEVPAPAPAIPVPLTSLSAATVQPGAINLPAVNTPRPNVRPVPSGLPWYTPGEVIAGRKAVGRRVEGGAILLTVDPTGRATVAEAGNITPAFDLDSLSEETRAEMRAVLNRPDPKQPNAAMYGSALYLRALPADDTQNAYHEVIPVKPGDEWRVKNTAIRNAQREGRGGFVAVITQQSVKTTGNVSTLTLTVSNFRTFPPPPAKTDR